MRIKLKNTGLTSDRFGLSDRATAAIASSVLQDFGIETNDDHTHVSDKNKLRREKSIHRSELQIQNKDKRNPLQGLYFYGRKDNSLVIEKVNSKQFRRTIKEEHYTILQESGSVYVGHIFLHELDIIRCDGTVTNKGWNTSDICTIEEQVKRPLQWGVCLLHFNELPFRHLFQTLDAKINSTCWTKSDSCPEDISVCESGPLSHSRWLTTANRVLRLYLSIENPTDEHRILVSFILKS
ncbi:hypothetical protein PR048_029276 [Dryococelus australis]|uniref:Uncharacterized protein n=1 Tax=Dryococelus australis TaxID=614101 RepID=A0ABQ9GCW0_9NEOP|nr:hypothetical protein PR048_029276 [Dryococelus australis]